MSINIQKNQSGMAHVLLGLIVVVVIAVIGGVAWKVSKNSSTPSTGINKVVQDKCMAEVNDSVFCKFAGAFGNVGDYKVIVNSTAEGSASVLELANDSKGNSSMVVKVNGQEQGNIISYSGVTYSKDYTDGQWFKYAASDTTKPSTVDLKKEFLKSDFKGDDGQKLEYKKIGTEKCDNLSCYKYQTVDSQKPTETDYIWFDTKDYLLRRATVNDSKTNSNAEMTISYASVVISAPSPTKDAPTADTTQ
ncbi:MAG: hypothetical protein Q7R60_03330 [bacterium]|nr:hypothetical protein [bacterium]